METDYSFQDICVLNWREHLHRETTGVEYWLQVFYFFFSHLFPSGGSFKVTKIKPRLCFVSSERVFYDFWMEHCLVVFMTRVKLSIATPHSPAAPLPLSPQWHPILCQIQEHVGSEFKRAHWRTEGFSTHIFHHSNWGEKKSKEPLALQLWK